MRRELYEIVAIIWLDDCSDNFIENIEKITELIYRKNFLENEVSKVIE